MNTLLTGFGPFLDIVSNPTERLVRYFERCHAPGHRLTTSVLPVSYARAPMMLLEAIENGDAQGRPFDLVWMLGVASGSTHWRVERFGRNCSGDKPDADDFAPPAQIGDGSEDILEVTVPVSQIVAKLTESGIPAMESNSAGTYLCNHALYTALTHVARGDRPTRVGFLHVPEDPETRTPRREAEFTFAQHILALSISLRVLAESNL